MKVRGYFTAVFALMLGVLVTAANSVQAARVTEKFDLTVTGYEFKSNFWIGRFPDRTDGGPSPISSLSISFVGSYFTPVKDAVQNGQATVDLSDILISVVSEDVPDLSTAGVVIDSFTLSVGLRHWVDMLSPIFPWPKVSGVSVVANLDSGGEDYGRVTVVIPYLFEPTPSLTSSVSEFRYGASLKGAFDSPVYRSDGSVPGNLTVTRTLLSSTPDPVPPGTVPLPASSVLLGAGLVLLGRVGRHGRGNVAL